MPRKVELKAFPYQTPIIDKPSTMSGLRVCDDAETLPSTFVRTIDFRAPLLSLASLERILARTDEELERVADLCSAEVVPHIWGLIPRKTPREYRQKKYPWHSLVAEVDRIQADESMPYSNLVPEPQWKTVSEGLMHYKRPFQFNRYLLADMDLQQFMYGRNIAQDACAAPPRLFLVDIEPLYRVRPGIGFM